MKPLQLILSFAIVAAMPFQSLAQSERAKSVATTREAEFCEDALEDNAKEIAMLEMGMDKATDPEIKEQAEHMLSDHLTIDSVLNSYVTRRKVQIMGEIDEPDEKHIETKTTRAWDEEWADELGNMQRKMITRFEKAQGYIRDEELQTIIKNTLPVLRQHRDVAIAQQRRMKAMKE
ncbi:DUF4142 domain-containing protein [Polluticoccus soli]|uniref:DUF4142 domain-containing protein n=1 Tax=Polluticoccus soli TaxID=3034150 RepID=UPI0023E1E8D3|nr:DUF4142 domain-containing protein [Flavipsychrobacter sp. JY13-12]